jgi:subtilisin family serine protease
MNIRLAWRAASAGLVVWSGAALGAGPIGGNGPGWTPDRVLVRWKAEIPARALGMTIARAHRQTRTSTVPVPPGSTVEQTLAELRDDPRVLYAGPNLRRRLLTLAPPNEPTWAAKDPRPDYTTRTLDQDVPSANQKDYMWALEKIKALEAWSVYPGAWYTASTRPADGVKVAVLDTGCDLAHPDWVNAGGAGPDVAQGGQIDVANAVSFLDGNTDPTPNDDDTVGHGTFTAGLVGAAANNGGAAGEGAIGVAYGARVMPIQVTNTADGGTVDDIISGIYYAVDHGAQIISISLGDYGYSPFEQDAIDYAWQNNVLVVAAAGNDGDTTNGGQNRVIYPAADNHVLAVGATASDDSPASYTNTGPYVGVAAPGGDAEDAGVEVEFFGPVPTVFAVWGTFPTHPYDLQVQPDGLGGTIDDYLNERYDYAPGTSAACPLVAGLAALYAQKNGITRNTPNAAAVLYQAVQRGADSTQGVANGGWSPVGGFGRINALNTLQDVDPRASTVGCIVGKLTSNMNAVGSGRVTATNGAITRNAVTRADGGFRFTNLPPGNYTVTASTTTDVGSLSVNVVPGVDNFNADFAFPWTTPVSVPGDVNQDKTTDLRDAVAAMRLLAGTDPLNPSAADRADIAPWAGTGGRPHGDGTLNADDVRAILKLAGGLAT